MNKSLHRSDIANNHQARNKVAYIKIILSFILEWTLLLGAAGILSFAVYRYWVIPGVRLDLLLFYMGEDVTGNEINSYILPIILAVFASILLALIFALPLYGKLLFRRYRLGSSINVKTLLGCIHNIRNKKANTDPISEETLAGTQASAPVTTSYSTRFPSIILRITYAIMLFAVTVTLSLVSMGLPEYLRAQNFAGNIFEKYYVDPATTNITFPANKRNLILIYLESMENTLAGRSSGGGAEKSRIPELEKLALDPQNVSFSNHRTLGGALQTYGLGWSLAGMAATTGGVPLLPAKPESINPTIRNNEIDSFLPGAYMLGDILAANGYQQTFMLAANANFGGVRLLLENHGNPKIIDNLSLKKQGKIPKDYNVFWGFEDRKLFRFAQQEINTISENNKPFALTLFTQDTHAPSGYVDDLCPKPFQEQYDNAYRCSSAQVYDFIKWVQSQPFGANTTIVLTGDHLGPNTWYYQDLAGGDTYTRTVYNVIINSAVKTKHNRPKQFTTMDYYPTILASLGATISGERIGIGTNLFSKKATLVEELGGITKFNDYLDRKSSYYNTKIFFGEQKNRNSE